MEVWEINKHGHEAVPVREGSLKRQWEPFVPKSLFDELQELFMDALGQGCGTWDNTKQWMTYDHCCLSTWEHGVRFALKMGWIVEEQVTR